MWVYSFHQIREIFGHYFFKKLKISTADKEVELLEVSYVAGGNAK